MFSTLLSIALASTLAIRGARADLDIATPTISQCGNTHVTWGASEGPYNLVVVYAANPCGDIIADLGDHTGLSMTWYNVSLAAGTQVMLSLEDATGEEGWTGAITVDASDDTSCLPVDAVANNIASTSATESASDSAAASSVTVSVGTSAVVPVTTLVAATKTASATSTRDTSAATAVGAANAGIDPLGSSSGALSLRQLGVPATLLSAVAAVLLVSL